jgi:hypothetical protein
MARLRRLLAGRTVYIGAVLLFVGLTACSTDSADPARQASPTPTFVRHQACQQEATSHRGDIRGLATGATLWALPFASLPFPAEQEIKVVWRMTGSGQPRFAVVGPTGVDPDAVRWGPEPHSGSYWNRPGDEWGTGIRFAMPGCWQVTVTRDRGTGSVWFRVA